MVSGDMENENLQKLRAVFPQFVKDGAIDFDGLQAFFKKLNSGITWSILLIGVLLILLSKFLVSPMFSRSTFPLVDRDKWQAVFLRKLLMLL